MLSPTPRQVTYWVGEVYPSNLRKGGRVVNCTNFENWRGFTVTEGSNPSLSYYNRANKRESILGKGPYPFATCFAFFSMLSLLLAFFPQKKASKRRDSYPP